MRALADEVGSELPDMQLPETSRDVLLLLYALLVAVEGDAVEARHVHDAWTVWKLIVGDTHAAMVPFDELSPDVQAADDPYVDAIRRVARRCTTTVNDAPA